MSKTLELLCEMKKAIKNGQMKAEQIPVQDVISCCVQEMMVNRNWYEPKEKFEAALNGYTETCERIISNSEAVLDVSILCMEMIPTPSPYNYSKWYWKNRMGSQYSGEMDEVLSYIEENKAINVFNYDFTEKYSDMNIDVFMDEASGHNYVIFDKKRMYFPIGWDARRISDYCVGIYMEQDSKSPHYYMDDEYGVREGDVVIDGGTAEGNFALSIVDKAKKIYLVEAEEEWIEALELTFAEYKDKVVIVNGFLDERSFENHYSLSDIAKEEVNYIKMDIEGFECNVLRGASALLANAVNLRMAICSYHCADDYEWITNFLSSLGYKTKNSRGYMFPEWEVSAAVNCELRRGIVFAQKQISE